MLGAAAEMTRKYSDARTERNKLPDRLACNKLAPPPEMVFINLTYEGDADGVDLTSAIPTTGILEFDYVSMDYPGQNCPPFDRKSIERAFSCRSKPEEYDECNIFTLYNFPFKLDKAGMRRPYPEDDDDIGKVNVDESVTEQEESWVIQALRMFSNKCCFLRGQAKSIIQKLKHTTNRVEFAVMCFRRLRHRHNFHDLLPLFSRTEVALIQKRLGEHNIYDEVSAVAYYELDLTRADHRFICAELVYLAVCSFAPQCTSMY